MKKLIVACDAQPLLINEKTGVGRVASSLMYQLGSHDDLQILAQAFTPDRELKNKFAILAETSGWETETTDAMSEHTYRKLWTFLPIRYRKFFRIKPDIQLFFNYFVPPGTQGKVMNMVHDMAHKAFPKTVEWKRRLLLDMNLQKSCRRADKILTVSEFSKLEIIRYLGIKPEKIEVIPNGVDLERFHPAIPAEDTERVREKFGISGRYFLYMGTLEPRKNIPFLLDSYARFSSGRKDAPLLVIAGRKGWLYESIFLKVRELNLHDSVVFTGYVADGDAAPLMAGARAFVFPSLYEGFGLPPLEAMACGIPVITSNTSSLPEVVGDAGILINPHDTQELAWAFQSLTDDDDRHAELSRKGLERAQGFSWEKAGDRLAGLCRETANG